MQPYLRRRSRSEPPPTPPPRPEVWEAIDRELRTSEAAAPNAPKEEVLTLSSKEAKKQGAQHHAQCRQRMGEEREVALRFVEHHRRQQQEQQEQQQE